MGLRGFPRLALEWFTLLPWAFSDALDNFFSSISPLILLFSSFRGFFSFLGSFSVLSSLLISGWPGVALCGRVPGYENCGSISNPGAAGTRLYVD
jgi:hypothetical protein